MLCACSTKNRPILSSGSTRPILSPFPGNSIRGFSSSRITLPPASAMTPVPSRRWRALGMNRTFFTVIIFALLDLLSHTPSGQLPIPCECDCMPSSKPPTDVRAPADESSNWKSFSSLLKWFVAAESMTHTLLGLMPFNFISIAISSSSLMPFVENAYSSLSLSSASSCEISASLPSLVRFASICLVIPTLPVLRPPNFTFSHSPFR